jgi:hypothetical protein
MVRQAKHSTAVYSGSRSDIDLQIISDVDTSSQITVQCNICQKQFSIARSSLRNERLLARKAHSTGVPSSAVIPHSSACDSVWHSMQPSTVVPSTGEGRCYLKDHCKVDKCILSVYRQLSSDGVNMLYAKTIDQNLHLLGRELPQSCGYPKVMYETGSTVELPRALRRCQIMFQRELVRKERMARYELQEDADWRQRIAAFNLVCNPKNPPRIEDLTASNIDHCIDLLTCQIPYDTDNPIFDDQGTCSHFPPRPGSHLPSHYTYSASHQCIIDHHPPESLDSPSNLLPVLVDIVSKDSRSDGKECIFQLRQTGELVKTWATLTADRLTRRIFPQLDALLNQPIHSIPFWDGEIFPPPERVSCKVGGLPLLTQSSSCLLETGQQRPLDQFGITVEEVRTCLSQHASSDAERRAELKRDIMQVKYEECLELVRIVQPDDPMLTPEAYAKCNARLETLEPQTHTLIVYVGRLPLKAKPRILPMFDTLSIEQLEDYQTCNSLHRRIVELLIHNSDVCDSSDDVPNMDEMDIEQLEAYWARLTE